MGYRISSTHKKVKEKIEVRNLMLFMLQILFYLFSTFFDNINGSINHGYEPVKLYEIFYFVDFSTLKPFIFKVVCQNNSVETFISRFILDLYLRNKEMLDKSERENKIVPLLTTDF